MFDSDAVSSGAASGVAAAMAMTGMRRLTTELGLIEEVPPKAVLRQKTPLLSGLVSKGHHGAVIELVHWTYGGMGGAAFGLLPAAVRRHRWAGPAYGLLAWTMFEAVLAPALGLEQAKRARPMERIMFALDHVVYGTVVARAH
ncbi:MAG: DUF1440 domain-containing protein [Actinomycetota bacterium]|nr:DUF1440 domain-containing protein [Actinomycetota bacterium]